jgi:putative transposase
VKTVAVTLEVARSNLIERQKAVRPRRGSQNRAGDVELIADIRRLVDQRPSYGYRRIAALLKRERRSAGHRPVNAKRVYRLMKKSGLLLARHTGRRFPRTHDGTIMTSCSDALEFTCLYGEIVRVAFSLDSHDREVISWVATNGRDLRRDDPEHDGTLCRAAVRRHAGSRQSAMADRQWIDLHRLSHP